MKRFGPGWGWMLTPLSDEGGGGGAGGGEKDVEYWKAEAKKAFDARDAIRHEMKALTDAGRVVSEDDKKRFADLISKEAKLAEDQKRAEGKFDELKHELVTKHQAELKSRDDRIADLERIISDREIDLAFANALVPDSKTPVFGGDDAFTVLTPGLAADALRKHIAVEHIETDGRKTAVVRVKNPQTGKVILGADGNPASFGKGIVELINLLPDKDRVLRGSGKTGSGSSGGSGGGGNGKVDFHNLTPAQMRDPEIIKAAKARTAAAGGMVIGEAWERPAAKAKA